MPKNQRRKVKQHQEAKANDGGHLEKQNMHEIEGEASSRGKPRANAWFIKESKEMQSDNSVTIQKKEEIRLRKLEQERIQANLFKAVGDLKQEVNNPGEQNPETHLFVTPPNILKQQLTGYCTSPASSPMGRDNKHGWYEEHEKFVAIATRSLSSVLLVGDSLVNGLARYHRVWSKYLEPLCALNFGVGGDRTQHVFFCEKFAKSIYEAIVKVSQGNVVDLVEDRKRSRSKSGSTTPPPKTQQKQNGQTTSMTFTTTVLPKPKPTATLPPPTAIAPKLKIPPTITSTLIR